MSKFGPKVFAADNIKTKGNFLVGTIWNAVASNGKSSYNIEMKENGFTCSCPAFRKCKHIRNVEEKFDE
jgi:hypothetical protein